jgi:hypothetical protein
MIFDCNKEIVPKLKQFTQTRMKIEIIHEYKYLGLIFIHMVTLSHLVKGKETHV